MKLIDHQRETSSLKCRACCEYHEIPKSCQHEPEMFAIFCEAIEQKHLAKGCGEAADSVERIRFRRSDNVRVWVRPSWGQMVASAENGR